MDIFLSHDWPRGIEQHGDVNDLLRKKKFLEREVLPQGVPRMYVVKYSSDVHGICSR